MNSKHKHSNNHPQMPQSGDKSRRPASGGSLMDTLFWQRLQRNKVAIVSMWLIGVLALLCLVIPWVWPYDFAKTDFLAISRPPSAKHWFGTDNLGRDVFVRCFVGGRMTFLTAFVAAFVVTVIGVVYGATAGYLGGRVDMLMMRVVDVLYGIPFLFFTILLMTLFGNHLWLSIIAIAAISWLDMARVVRGQTLGLKHKEFVLAAQLSGLSHCNIILRHIIPNLLGVVIVYAALAVPTMVVLSAVLSFFGLGVSEPMTSWGLLISNGASNLNRWWLLLAPAGLMTVTLLALAFFANGLRDALDPQQ